MNKFFTQFLAILTIALGALAPLTTSAQEAVTAADLPKEMSGDAVFKRPGGAPPIYTKFSVTISKMSGDAVEGVMSRDPRTCKTENAPWKGTYSGGILRFSAEIPAHCNRNNASLYLEGAPLVVELQITKEAAGVVARGTARNKASVGETVTELELK
jgi:hypothetical protein